MRMKYTDTSYKMLDPDNCAMCGMCLTYCPTYRISNNESESPRGRISIIHGLNESMLEPSESALKHINSCTLCMACEKSCPAKVDFYTLMTDARDKYFKDQNVFFIIKTNLISMFLTNNFLKKISSTLIYFLNKKIFKSLNSRIFIFMNYVQKYNKHYDLDTPEIENDTIGIFTGCASDLFQKDVANSCIRILKKHKINSKIIKNVKCCGSLDYNSGKIKSGVTHSKSAIKEFKSKKYKKVIGYASGCSSFINKYEENVNYQDATAYILDLLSNKKQNDYKITKSNVCIHKPCTSRTAEIDFNKLLKSLNSISGINIFVFEDNYCCGAGAQNLIHNKKNSRDMIESKIKFIKSNNIEYLLTCNIGCSLNFIDSINLNNYNNIQVKHPITFLNDRLV